MRRFELGRLYCSLPGPDGLREAQLVAVLAEPRLVRRPFAELLGEPLKKEEKANTHKQRSAILKRVRDEE